MRAFIDYWLPLIFKILCLSFMQVITVRSHVKELTLKRSDESDDRTPTGWINSRPYRADEESETGRESHGQEATLLPGGALARHGGAQDGQAL